MQPAPATGPILEATIYGLAVFIRYTAMAAMEGEVQAVFLPGHGMEYGFCKFFLRIFSGMMMYL